MKLIYSINADMSGALCVAKEIVSITGMTPELIEVDESTKVKYNKIDSFKVDINPFACSLSNIFSSKFLTQVHISSRIDLSFALYGVTNS